MSSKDGIHFNEIHPDQRFFEEGRYDTDKVREVVKSHGIKEGGVNVSEGDPFFIPFNIRDSELLELVKDKFNIEDLNKDALIEINECFTEARDYLINYLGIKKLPDPIMNFEGFKNKTEVINFLKNTRSSKKSAPYFCPLSFLVLAEKEFNSSEMEGFVQESDYLFDKMVEDKDGISYFYKQLSPDSEYEEYSVMTGNSWINKVNISFRGKSRDSIITKFARYPEINADEVIRDGIGLKFDVESDEDAYKLVGFLGKYFQDNLGSDIEYLQNVEFLDEEKVEELKDSFAMQGADIPIVSKKNTTSNKNFRTIKLRGKIRLPRNGKEDNVKVNRSYEVQIVVANNKNERGMADHSVYKAVQKLSALTRLFGSFTEYHLCKISKQASKETGLNDDNIKEYIKKNFLSVIVPDEKAKKPIVRYGSTDQMERMKTAGLLPTGLEYEPLKDY